jgi:hypothetical protein
MSLAARQRPLGRCTAESQYQRVARSSIYGPVLAGLVLAAGLIAAHPVAAEPTCRQVMPDHASDASGYTFRATVTGFRLQGERPPLTFITLAIKKVYANRDSDQLQAGATIEIYSNLCDGFGQLGLEVRDEILMSTAWLDGGNTSTWNTAVWHVHGNRLRLAILKGEDFGKIWYTADRRIADADSLLEALALVAPDALGVPDTATETTRKSPVPVWPFFLAGVYAVLLSALVFRGRFRAAIRTSRRNRWL